MWHNACMSTHIVGIVGSLRRASYNRSLMHAFIDAVPEDVAIEIAEIDALPLFNQDIEDPYPVAAASLKKKITAADAVLIVSPEYNRGVPGVLKNAIDWMSRGEGKPFSGKPVLVAGASDGSIGTAVMQVSLKHSLMHVGAHIVPKPEFCVSFAQDKFDAQGKLTDEKTREFIDKALQALLAAVPHE